MRAGPVEQGLVVDRVDLVYATSRGALTALQDLSLSVGPQEFVSVLGPSGCGKSSLLKLASGLLAPTAGHVRLSGVPVLKPRSDVGIVFQQATLLPWKTVLDNVLVPIRAMKLPVPAYRQRAEELLALAGLAKFMHHYPRELSGGMQQRVALARGLIHDPKLLLMDEPFSALDAMTREYMMDELQRIWLETRKAVLFITHSIPEAVYLSDRIIVMSGRPGRVVEQIDVGMARPRTQADLGSPRFIDLCKHLRDRFRAAGMQA
ncbi:ABC transporter ATP-binding protein [Xylophilus sp. GW821-FHT01B05]